MGRLERVPRILRKGRQARCAMRRVTELVPEAGSGEARGLRGRQEAPPKKVEQLEKELKKLQKDEGFKSVESKFDEEHNLWEVSFIERAGRGAVDRLGAGFQRRSAARLIAKYQADRALHGAAVRGRVRGEGLDRRVRMATAADAEGEAAETENGR